MSVSNNIFMIFMLLRANCLCSSPRTLVSAPRFAWVRMKADLAS